jgi:hypothetical protein
MLRARSLFRKALLVRPEPEPFLVGDVTLEPFSESELSDSETSISCATLRQKFKHVQLRIEDMERMRLDTTIRPGEIFQQLHQCFDNQPNAGSTNTDYGSSSKNNNIIAVKIAGWGAGAMG